MLQLESASLRQILDAYRDRETENRKYHAGACASIAQRALALDEPLLAYDFCAFGLVTFPDDLRLRQLQGLALARSGAFEQGRLLLEKLYAQGNRDEETLGILARTYKDLWLEQGDSSGGRANLRRSQELYEESYVVNGGHWSGINAATLASVLGAVERSDRLAVQVRDQCLAMESKAPGDDRWRAATLGESSVLLGERDTARSWYRVALNGAGPGDRASMRRNARLAIEAKRLDRNFIREVFPPMRVVVFSGHRIDESDRAQPRFPEQAIPAVRNALFARLEQCGACIGYAAAAAGGDILFHEVMLELGYETHVVLPQPADEFAARSVASAGPAWIDRFHKVLERASSVIVHSGSISGEIGYAYNSWICLGLARSRARRLEGEGLALALWDGEPGLPGGTSDAVRDWQGFGQQVEALAPLESASPNWCLLPGSLAQSDSGRSIGSKRIISMLFADAAGFSKLADNQIPAFVEHFLGTFARVIAAQKDPPLARNTWGDGLYVCFATPRRAGQFALALSDAVRTTDWAAYGLPAGLSLRIALHSGPAYEFMDPVLQQRGFTGAHVSRAARIEPVTPPGSVYCSQPFAAMCECEQVRDFACEYVGNMPLAKNFGEYPMFAVRPALGADTLG